MFWSFSEEYHDPIKNLITKDLSKEYYPGFGVGWWRIWSFTEECPDLWNNCLFSKDVSKEYYPGFGVGCWLISSFSNYFYILVENLTKTGNELQGKATQNQIATKNDHKCDVFILHIFPTLFQVLHDLGKNVYLVKA